MSATRPSWSDASAYSVSFARLCAGTVDHLLDALPPGRTLLDVGTGTGAVLAGALDRGWEALGVDSAPEMLKFAASAISLERLQLASLPALPFPDSSFDAVTANFVVNHLPDPRAGVRELARVAKPEGAVALTIWPSEISTMNDLCNRVMAAAGVRPPEASRLLPASDFERTTRGLARLCQEAGLVVDVAEEVAWTFSIEPGDLWLGVEGGIGTIGQTYLRSDAVERGRLRHAYNDLADVGSDKSASPREHRRPGYRPLRPPGCAAVYRAAR